MLAIDVHSGLKIYLLWLAILIVPKVPHMYF